MSLSKIQSIQVDQKINIRLGILDVSFIDYSGGKRTRIKAKDEEGDLIDIVGFNDVFEVCSKLSTGNTYVFNDVIVGKFNDNLQLKITSFSSIHTSISQISPGNITIDKVSNMNEGEYLNIVGIVSETSEDVTTNQKTGSKTRKYVISDETGDIILYAINDASTIMIDIGKCVAFRGKVGNNKALVTFNSMNTISNESIEKWWKTVGSNRDSKRVKTTTFTQIANITTDMIGERIDVAGIITTASLVPSTTQSGTLKRVISVTDSSCKSIETTIFGEGAKSEYIPGKEIFFTAIVSDWNNMSLIMNTQNSTGPKIAINKYSSLEEWWSNEGKFAEIENISSQVLPEIVTIENALQKNLNDRLTIKGMLENSMLSDSSGSIKLIPHSSCTIDITTMNGNCTVRNAILSKKDPPELVVFRNSVKMDETNESRDGNQSVLVS